MSKRKQWISLMLLISLLITIGAGAETSLPGQITMMSYSDGELYFQVETYPTASIYRYTPATMQQPELIRNDFQAEQDIVFVVHGICYLWNGSDALIAKDESGESISLHIQEMSQRGKNYMPFLGKQFVKGVFPQEFHYDSKYIKEPLKQFYRHQSISFQKPISGLSYVPTITPRSKNAFLSSQHVSGNKPHA